MTHLRQLMLDELQRRNYSQSTTRCYLHAVEDFARYFHRSPERLGPDHIRQYQVHLFRDRKLSPGTIGLRTCALRFLYVKTLGRPYLPDHIPFPKRPLRLPTILDQQEVARLIDSASNLMHRTMMMMLYATGLRRAEMCHLKVADIDSERRLIRVERGKGGRYRNAMLPADLLTLLREWWKAGRQLGVMHAQGWLFPGQNAMRPISTRQLHRVAVEAARAAEITKRVGPHTLRHSFATHLLEDGVDIRVIQALLGHAKLENTAFYTQVATRTVRAVTSPLDKLGLFIPRQVTPDS